MGLRRNLLTHESRIEIVVNDLHTLVSELRHVGLGTCKALREVARKLRIGQRRVAHLYYRDQPVLVSEQQQSWIAQGAIRVLIHLGDEHMRAAARCHAKAEAIRERQRQLELPLGEAKCAPGLGTYSLGCAA